MATLDNVLSLLDKWPKWKRVTSSPERIDAIEAQLSEMGSAIVRLEELIGGKAAGESCRYCGALALRLDRQRPPYEHWKCGDCGKEEQRAIMP